MAPRKRKAEEEDGAAAKTVTATSTRVTRSSTRLANSNSAVPPPDLPQKKKGKANGKKEKAKPEKKHEAENKNEEAKEEVKEVIAEDGTEKGTEKGTAGDVTARTIVIEHCKQCNSFKTRAILVKDGLEKGVPGVTVLLNPEKPRRGCFEIREQNGGTFISLLDMKRPFKPMKDLDMEKVISDIIDKIKS